MSLSNNQEIISPVQKYFEWSGSKGGFSYYDKEAKVKVAVPLPFKFIVLDTLSTIKGFNDADQSGYWSNEVRNINADILTVRTKKGICAKGNYEQVITHRDCTGARYCQSVYMAYVDGKDMKIGNIAIMGAALSSWIDFRKKNKIFASLITVAGMTEGKKGATTYQIPTFTISDLKPEIIEKATKMDVELQEYLTKYFSKNAQQQSEQAIAETVKAEPIVATSAPAPAASPTASVVMTETGLPASLLEDDLGLPF